MREQAPGEGIDLSSFGDASPSLRHSSPHEGDDLPSFGTPARYDEAVTRSPLLSPGTVVGGDFVVAGALSEGGMGAVYVVDQKSTGKRRALKVMHPEILVDPAMQRRFAQEARIGSRIRSEHVVEVIAAGVDEALGLPFLVMELLEGQDLRHRIDASGRASHDEVSAIFAELCHAMAAAHAAGVVHRDLKPENVFLARSRRANAEAVTVKVLDFGIARIAQDAGTRATVGTIGTPMWMAPEQTSPGEVSTAADVWALALIAYELLTGKRFWRAAWQAGATTAQLLREIVLDPIPPASDRAAEQGTAAALPEGFDAWFARCLQRDPRERFADAAAMWRAMQQILPTAESLAKTLLGDVALSAPPPPALETGKAAPYDAAPRGRSAGEKGPAETPIAVAGSSPPPRRAKRELYVALAIAAAGIAGGALLSRRPRRPNDAVITPRATSVTGAAASAASLPPAPQHDPVATADAAPAPLAASAPVVAPVAVKPAKAANAPGGFTDPTDRGSAVIWKVQGRHVRLFTRLVSNESNVADLVVRNAVDWNSWEYARCYESVFGGAKSFPEGIVTVAFDILDQLPRHATLASSTVESARFNECVAQTLVGQTINAAGPDGAGHVTYAFRFVPMD